MCWSISDQAIALIRELESLLFKVLVRGDRGRFGTRLVAVVVLST